MGEPPAGAEAENFERQRRLIQQDVQARVQNGLNDARSQMATSPDGAMQVLRGMLETVRQVSELAPEVRDQYEGMLQAALRQAAQRKVEFQESQRREQEGTSIARERQNIIRSMLRSQEKVKQLMARFDSLMDEGKYRFAEEVNVVEAAKLLPAADTLPPVAAFDARTIGYYQDMMANRTEKMKAWWDTLYQVEKSNIPLPRRSADRVSGRGGLAAVDRAAVAADTRRWTWPGEAPPRRRSRRR